MSWSNFHQHSQYDDGVNTIEDHVKSAIEQDVISLGFSGHCPVPYENGWSMKKEDLPKYFKDIELAKAKYGDRIQLYRSLELDFIPGMLTPSDEWIKDLALDYTLGSVHFVGTYDHGRPWEIDGPHQTFLKGLHEIYNGDVKYVVKKYFDLTRQMILDASPEVVGHLDKIKMQNRGFWSEDDDWYRDEIYHTLEEIKAKNVIIEVNTRGIYKKLTPEPYPGPWILKQIQEMHIPIQLNSDAHHPREITQRFRYVAGLLKSIGFNEMMIFLDHQWQTIPFDEKGLVIT